jgi:hypothetical protein
VSVTVFLHYDSKLLRGRMVSVWWFSKSIRYITCTSLCIVDKCTNKHRISVIFRKLARDMTVHYDDSLN